MIYDLLHHILLGKENECALKIHNLLEAVHKHDKHIKKGIEICCSFPSTHIRSAPRNFPCIHEFLMKIICVGEKKDHHFS